MKRILLFLSLVFITCFITGQDLDLIVTTNNDSIACKIDSISEDKIHFTGKKDNNPISSHIEVIAVSEYKYNCIKKSSVKPVRGTIYFHSDPIDEVALRKNAIYGTVGFFGVYATASLNLERIIIPYSNRIPLTFSIQFGAGGYVEWDVNGNWLSGSIRAITGQKSNHLEFSLGAAFLYANYYKEWSNSIAGGVGYRYQKPGGFFLFRTGIAYPESAYLSLGFVF